LNTFWLPKKLFSHNSPDTGCRRKKFFLVLSSCDSCNYVGRPSRRPNVNNSLLFLREQFVGLFSNKPTDQHRLQKRLQKVAKDENTAVAKLCQFDWCNRDAADQSISSVQNLACFGPRLMGKSIVEGPMCNFRGSRSVRLFKLVCFNCSGLSKYAPDF
jgi:hypothetical protein